MRRVYTVIIPDGGDPTTVPVPTLDATATVDRLLSTVQGNNNLIGALSYLGSPLRQQVEAGQLDAGSLLGQQNPFQAYSVEGVLGSGDPTTTYVQVTLFYGSSVGYPRIFEVSTREDGVWRIFSVREVAGAAG